VSAPFRHRTKSKYALKLWSIERKSHVMALVAGQGTGTVIELRRKRRDCAALRA
jgi:hypothetical protein